MLSRGHFSNCEALSSDLPWRRNARYFFVACTFHGSEKRGEADSVSSASAFRKANRSDFS
ncbi:hypothetical protein C5688_17825 [Methylocystis sp. MitZ-2018]|nr:hypothetical protein C5688_17825 [Methylocystis sp. MitZ-2018]